MEKPSPFPLDLKYTIYDIILSNVPKCIIPQNKSLCIIGLLQKISHCVFMDFFPHEMKWNPSAIIATLYLSLSATQMYNCLLSTECLAFQVWVWVLHWHNGNPTFLHFVTVSSVHHTRDEDSTVGKMRCSKECLLFHHHFFCRMSSSLPYSDILTCRFMLHRIIES